MQMEMLFCSTVVGLPMLIPPMLLTGELFKAWNSCSQVRFLKYIHYIPCTQDPSILFKKKNNKKILVLLVVQHLYIYGVLVFEAMATFIGQVSVLSLIALFGAATTAMVNPSHKLEAFPLFHYVNLLTYEYVCLLNIR